MSQSITDAVQVIDAGADVIMREAMALRRMAHSIDGSFAMVVGMVENRTGNVVTTGLGKSGLAAAKIAATLSSTGTPAFYVHSADALHGDAGVLTSADVLLAVSNSGETHEVCSLMRLAKARDATVVGITARPQSTLGSGSDLVLRVAVEKEADPLGLIPSCSAAAVTAVGDALAIVLMGRRDTTYSDFAMNHPGGDLGRRAREHRPAINGVAQD